MWRRTKKTKAKKAKLLKTPPSIQNVRTVMESFCDLYTEGLTITELLQRTKLDHDDVLHVLKYYNSFFMTRKFKTSKAEVKFIYLRRARSLKCAYTLFKHSDISQLRFNWDQDDYEFIFEITDPRYRTRTFESIRQSLSWTTDKLTAIIEKWQDKGVICKKGNRISFTYLGWPLWATITVARIWMRSKNEENPNGK